MLLLTHLLSRLIRYGELNVVDSRGVPHRFVGAPVAGIDPVTIRLHDARLEWELALRPGLVAGEAYMDGRLTIEQGSLADFLALACHNIHQADRPPGPVGRVIRLLSQYNPILRARRNVAHHYDLSDRLYSLFLDSDRQYSCAYFARPDLELEQAQEAKKRHIAAKLLLEPGQHVLDIGCGWGGLAVTLAQAADISVSGITLSREQLHAARRRAVDEGVSARVQFEMLDYRHAQGRFDRIVSVGMFEHVGISHYRAFFERIGDLLTPDGIALVHTIGRANGGGSTNAWMRKYIFPGGYSPALSEIMPAIEASGLFVTDIEILHGHYAETIAEWRRRFQANRGEIAKLYNERFCRMWDFYLTGAEMAFRHQGHAVFQIQLARDPACVPMTRDYMVDAERALDHSGNRRAAE